LCETENELTTVAADTGSRTKRLIPECHLGLTTLKEAWKPRRDSWEQRD